jgi:hypothetical protein
MKQQILVMAVASLIAGALIVGMIYGYLLLLTSNVWGV